MLTRLRSAWAAASLFLGRVLGRAKAVNVKADAAKLERAAVKTAAVAREVVAVAEIVDPALAAKGAAVNAIAGAAVAAVEKVDTVVQSGPPSPAVVAALETAKSAVVTGALLCLLSGPLVALCCGGCAGPVVTSGPASQPAPAPGFTTRLKAEVSLVLATAESDALPFLERWAPQWAALEFRRLEAAGDPQALAQVAADQDALEQQTIDGAKLLGFQVSADTAARLIQTFLNATRGQ